MNLKGRYVLHGALIALGLLLIVALGPAAQRGDPARLYAAELAPTAPAVDPAQTGPARRIVANPAAVYCADQGYQYATVTEPRGQRGVCRFPDGTACDAWEFLTGKCGAEFSLCAKRGYTQRTLSDGRNPFSREYAVCVSPRGQVIGSVTALGQIIEKARGCAPGQCPEETGTLPQAPAPLETAPIPGLAVPAAFNWHTHQGQDWLSPVKDQGGCGSCWAFATVGGVEAAHNIAAGNPDLDLDLSEQYLVSDCCTECGSCNGGNSAPALALIRDRGIPDEACMPYTGINGPCAPCADWASRLTYIDETGGVALTRQAIQQALVSMGPLVANIGMNGSFDENGVYRCPRPSFNHLVVVTGYDDAGGYWIAKNSWGAGWNGDGYFRIAYGECGLDTGYLAYALVGSSTTTSLAPVADAQVKQASPTKNYGTLDNLRIRDSATEDIDSYLKFTVGPLSGPVLSAQLRLYVFDGSDSGGVLFSAPNTYRGSTTDWTETGLTYGNAPGGTAQVAEAGTVASGTWAVYNVTSAITGPGTYSFLLSSRSSNSLLAYAREAAANRPELVITTLAATPHPPVQLQPPNDAIFSTRTVTFTWQASDTPDQIELPLRISASPDPAAGPWLVNVAMDPASTSYTHVFDADGRYYWHMQTSAASGSSSWVTRTLRVDTTPPVSWIEPLPATTTFTTFTVSWYASDATTWAATYDIDVQDNGGPWTAWQTSTADLSAPFTGQEGHTYSFRSRARDAAGNQEALHTTPDATITIVAGPHPPNDDFDHAIVIASLPYSNTQDTTGASQALDEPSPTCGPDDLTTTVWYRYTASADGTVRFETTGSTYDTVMVIATGTRGDLTTVACSDDAGDGSNASRIDLSVTASTTYHIAISGWWWDTGTLVFAASDLSAPPALQTFAPTDDAQVKSESPAKNYGALTNLRLRLDSASDIDSYLKFNVTGLGGPVVRATLRLFVYDGSPSGGMASLAANTYRATSTPWSESVITWNNRPEVLAPLATVGSVANNTWIEYDVTGAVAGDGVYTFALSSASSNSLYAYSKEAASNRPELVVETRSGPVPPANDDFDHAQIIGALPFSHGQSTDAATSADDDPRPSCGDVGGNVWFRYTAPADQLVRFETTGSDYDTWLAVLAGARGALTEVACNDDAIQGQLTSQIDAQLTGGVTYYLLIGGDDGDSGSLTLSARALDDLCAAVTQIPRLQCEALVALYRSTGGDSWTNRTGWLQNNTPCAWYGVECTGNTLEGIRLENNNLVGTIPPEVRDLDGMFGFNLSHNHLSGPIPPEVGDMLWLEDLYLQGNDLSGPIPPEIANLSVLNILNLSDNHLTGPIPSEIGTMHPWTLDLSANMLEGTIPPELGNNNALERLSLHSNRLAGEVPAALLSLPLGADRLDIGYNMLIASDPAVVAWLNTVDPDWASTQTVPPTGVAAFGVSPTEIAVSWTPIAYNQGGGNYVVGISTTPGGPYGIGFLTLTKGANGCTLEGLQPNTTYYIAVLASTPAHDDQQSDLVSVWSAEVSATTLPLGPDNDDFDNATIIPGLPYSTTQQTDAATSAPDDPRPSCWDVGPNVWYRFTAPQDMILHLDTLGSSYDTWLAVLTGSRGALTELACNDDASEGDLDSLLEVAVDGGATYHILIGGDDGESGTLVFSARESAPPVTLTFAPSHDAQVKSSYPTSRYGALNNLRVRLTSTEDIDSYLKFDVLGLTGPVQRATLRLFAYDGTDNAGAAYLASNTYLGTSTPWVESGLTWLNAPGITGAPLSSAGSVANGTWVEYDVTAAITASGTYSFALSGTSTNSLLVYSKEATSNRPELVIVTSGSAGLALATAPQAVAPALPVVEAEAGLAQRVGTWTEHRTDASSGGGYLYSSGAAGDALTLGFSGPQIEIVYVEHPALGEFAVEVDGALLQTVTATAEETQFGVRLVIGPLADGPHTLRVYAMTGTIAIDAFAAAGIFALPPESAPVSPPPVIIVTEPPVETPAAGPTETPVETPVEIVTVTPAETPTETPSPTPDAPDSSESSNRPSGPPLETAPATENVPGG